MSVNTTLAGLSKTASSNGPDGSVDAPSTIDDAMRYALSFIATLRDGKGFTNAAQLVCAATLDIGGQDSMFIEVSGATGPVTSLGTNYNGLRITRFAGTPTINHNASTLILPGAANIAVQAGDCALWMPKTTAGTADGWQCVAYQRATGAAIATPADPGIAGQSRNLKASLTANGTSITFTADQIDVAVSLAGASQRLASYSQALNISTTGAGGMDTGAAPTSGFLAVYAIAKADGTQSILGVNAATSTGTIYSGANMPSGYTYSALIGIWPTNATPQLLAGLIDENRNYFYQTVKVIASNVTGPSSLTSQSVSAAVPVTAKAAHMTQISQNGSTYAEMITASDATGTGIQLTHGATDASSRTMPSGMVVSTWNATHKDVLLVTAQTIYWMTLGSPSEYLYCTGYRF